MSKPDIHSTAIVHEHAELDDDVTVGPYCIVDEHVKLGRGTRLQGHVVVTGDTYIGEACEIFAFASIGQRTQDLKHKGGMGRVEIGNNTVIREYVTVHQPTDNDNITKVGDSCHLLAYSHIAHECLLGNGIIMSNNTQLAGHVMVEDDVVFGGMCGIHQFVRIGRMAMIGATAKVTQDIVPFTLADGSPATCRTVNSVGMQRHGFLQEQIRTVSDAYRVLFRESRTLNDAINTLKKRFPEDKAAQHMAVFAENSERGLARPRL
jgi:UDP-N-acetylglucosamine acyltransferase